MSADHDGIDLGSKTRPTKSPYKAYLVRCWQEGQGMRYSLERIGGSERRGFEDAIDLLAVLKNELEGGHSK